MWDHLPIFHRVFNPTSLSFQHSNKTIHPTQTISYTKRAENSALNATAQQMLNYQPARLASCKQNHLGKILLLEVASLLQTGLTKGEIICGLDALEPEGY